ncbi:MAG: PadR family transcriptional regulator [Clostridia bacterium]
MKTADLIPLILFELDECDKYGFELTKNIETKSNSKIIIKQPTLYTLLKKLEKSKFISSYWQDSDIGGKRHYYKITANGKLQLSTLPPYAELIRSICEEDNASLSFVSEDQSTEDINSISSVENINNTHNTVPSEIIEEKKISIMDALLDNKPMESVLPTEEVFASDNVDNITEFEINTTNSEVLKDEAVLHNEQFAENTDVAKFTEKVNISEEYKSQFNDLGVKYTSNLDDIDYNTKINNEIIDYVEYVDFKRSEKYIKSKRTTNRLILKSFITSLYMLIVLAISYFVCRQHGTTPFYYVTLISGLSILFFYPIIIISQYNNLRLQLQEKDFKYNLKKRIFISLSIFLALLIITIVVNINIGANTMYSMLSLSNFGNFYTPLILSTALFADNLFTILLIKKN